MKYNVKSCRGMLMKKWLGRISLLLLVIICCFVFAEEALFLVESIEDKAETMSVEDILVTIVDEDTICLENLIKGEEITYCWLITNTIEGTTMSSGSRLELDEKEVTEFTYEDLESIEFQAVVHYEGYTYTSNTFCVNGDGTLYVDLEKDTATVESDEEVTRDISDIVSLAYLSFILIVALLYYLVPKRMQWWILLGASVLFYLLSGVQYIVIILLSSWITFLVAKKMSEVQEEGEVQLADVEDRKQKKELKAKIQTINKQWLAFGLIGSLGAMLIIKYTSFVISNFNAILHIEIPFVDFIMPLGLSFYTFMLIAYLIDVYRNKYKAEQTFARFFLYVSFFPHITQGPISRYNDVAPQFKEYHRLNYDGFCMSVQRILWGFFVKLVLADRIAILVNGIYGSYETQSGLLLILGTAAYSIQIYADFYSSMEIAIGTAQMFGIQLTENFMRPYFSRTMPEFWRRWHITLGTWFKDYVFYPISISKRVMKYSVKVRKKFGANVARVVAAAPPIMGVWLLTGLWHGAMWKFVAWGAFHGILILLSTACSQSVQDLLHKLKVNTESFGYRLLQMMKVFVLCSIGRIFFRANSLAAAFTILWNMVTLAQGSSVVDWSEMGLSEVDYVAIPIALIILIIISILQEKWGSVRELINRRHIIIRWTIWLLLLFAVILFGEYGPGTSPVFLYEAF